MALKVGIVGAGAIGTYVGGRLALGGADVVLVGRPWLAERVAAGLSLSRWGQGTVALPADRLRVATEIEAVAGCDVVFVATKAKDTASVGAALAALPPRERAIRYASLQNGLKSAQVLQGALPGRVVWPGVVSFNVVWADDGARLHQGTSGPVVLPPDAADVIAVMRAGGLEAETHPDVVGVQWMKLLFNLNNAVNALSGLTLREQLVQRSFRRVMAEVVDEARAVMRAAGVRPRGVGTMQPWLVAPVLRLPDVLFFRVASAMIRIDPEARSSMAEDLRAGRTTEVDELNGEIVRLAAGAGVAAPRNAKLVALVHEAEASPRTWAGPELLAALGGAA
ncbi:MAG: 2-dehydropantoate 2-reductase [Myxococcota bacterium]